MAKARTTERERALREREHFASAVGGEADIYWADKTEAGRRRQGIRGDMLRVAADVEGKEGARILEVGCGTGAYSRPMARGSSATVIAFDLTPDLLHRAKVDATNLHYLAASATHLPFPDAGFDAVVGNAVLHHLPLESSVPELLRVLKPGGRFCFAEPNWLNPHVMLERSIPALRRRLRNSPDEVAFTRWGIRAELESMGLCDVAVRPFDFLYPATPRPLIGIVGFVGRILERIAVVREIAGSLLITARRR
jgi:SAM-dependent methyltransferase